MFTLNGFVWALIILALLALIVPRLLSKKEEEAESSAAEKQPPETIPAPKPVRAAHPADAVAEAEAIVAHAAAAPAVPAKPDNLKKIEGIGPKIASVLNAAGILTFAQLAATSAGRIREILAAEDPRLARLADPTTWAEQAQLAAAGKWDDLAALQDALKGGRRV